MKILIAGIGKSFSGDDAFGCEVVRHLMSCVLPPEVTVRDFGARSHDLAYALTRDYDTIILVDAIARGHQPGTVCLMEPDAGAGEQSEPAAVAAHAMDPISVIRMAQALGGVRGRLLLVGCEPAVLENDSGDIGLSNPVHKAIPHALKLIELLIGDLLKPNQTSDARLQRA